MSPVARAGHGPRPCWIPRGAGELLTAFDLAARGLAEHPDDVRLRHRAVVALARTGSTAEAARRFLRTAPPPLRTRRVAALGARIQKDIALAAAGAERQRLAPRAAGIHARTGGYHPATTAATMSMLAGKKVPARRLARAALAAIAGDGVYELTRPRAG